MHNEELAALTRGAKLLRAIVPDPQQRPGSVERFRLVRMRQFGDHWFVHFRFLSKCSSSKSIPN
jgi:hypothetical protein